jgi:type I restriction enzyme M protein
MGLRNILRDDGLSYGDNVEQLTFLPRETLTIHREDFWATTSNKQLNFVQHIFSSLRMHGRAAVVLPDNVLFEGCAGETVRRELLKQGDLHTILRLLTGLFYARA